jgi:hypothetical protein
MKLLAKVNDLNLAALVQAKHKELEIIKESVKKLNNL